jgi:hypothetical protein
MRKKLLFLVAFVCSFSLSVLAQDSTATCTATEVLLTMNDSYSDGWDSGSAVISDVDGNEVFYGTLGSDEGEATEALCLEDGVYSLTVGGSLYLNEMSFVLGDIASGGAGTYNFIVGDIIVSGCTDLTALNYDALATEDDGSCVAVVEGCMDAAYAEFNADANVSDGSCSMINCDANLLTVTAGGGSFASEISWDITLDTAVVASGVAGSGMQICIEDGYYDLNLYDSYGDGWNGNTISVMLDTAGYAADSIDVSDAVIGYGTIESGSFESLEMIVGDLPTLGCTDATAFNYDASAEANDGSCVAVSMGCIDVTAENFNSEANTEDGSCTYVPGCIDPTAVNFNPAASEDDGSCNYVSCLQTAALLTFTMPDYYGSETSLSIIDVNGQELAYIDGGFEDFYTNDLCLSPANSYTAILMDSYGDGWGTGASFSVTTCEGSLIAAEGTLLTGSADSIAFSVQSCDSYVFGCMDTIASNFDALVTEDDGSCTYLGCTDPMYLEFDATANLDDASCVTLAIEGCMDAAASNYNMEANLEDGSCILSVPCDSGLVGMLVSLSDSYGDGWNGNEYALGNSMGEVVSVGTIEVGDAALDTLCVEAGCYTMSVAGGSYITETSWSITTEFNGVSIVSGGGDNAVTAFGLDSDDDCSLLLGCTDSLATNFNELAITNDGTCEYITSETCEEAIAIGSNSSFNGSFNEQTWYSITLESQQFVAASNVPATGFFYTGELELHTACDSTDEVLEFGILDAGTYLISCENTSFGANGDGYVLTVTSADVVDGCTDSYASNYNELANIEDGSCLYPCDAISSTLTIFSGSYGSEVYWEMLDSLGMILAYGGPYPNSTSYEIPLCLSAGMDYTMNTYDVWGDGWNGGTYDIVATCGEDTLTSFTYTAANNGGASPSDLESVDIDGYHLEGAEVFTMTPCADVMLGCMEETAFNFDSLANVAAECVPFLYGCMDVTALNFDADANTDTPEDCVFGCDGEFVTVSIESGSYGSEVSWTLFDDAGSQLLTGGPYSNNLTFEEQICLPLGANMFQAVDSYGDGWNGGSFAVVTICDSLAISLVSALPTGDGGDYDFNVISCDDITPGCIDIDATNFDPEASHSDNSCVYPIPELLYPIDGKIIDLASADSIEFAWDTLFPTLPSFYYVYFSTDASEPVESAIISTTVYANEWTDYSSLYNLFIDNGYGAGEEFELFWWVTPTYYAYEGSFEAYNATTNSLTLTISAINGCTDATALNYNSAATVDDASCEFPCETGLTLIMNDSYGDSWNGNVLSINGMDYTLDGVADDGENATVCVDVDTTSCISITWTTGSYVTETSWTLLDSSANLFAEGSAGSGAGVFGECVYGCTDEAYAEFNPLAQVDDASCLTLLCAGDIVTLTMMDSYGDGGGSITIAGSTYNLTSGSSQDFGACVDLSVCTDVIYAATDNWSSENSWSVSDASGAILAEAGDASGSIGTGCATLGCMDPAAANYDMTATEDDNSCEYEGCTDQDADNYDEDATIEDGSCAYSCAEGQAQVDILVSTDGYANETGFTLVAGDDTYAVDFTSSSNLTTVTNTFCLDNGTNIIFTLTDTYGDGIVNGGYQIFVCEEPVSANFNFNTASASEEMMVSCGDITGCMDESAINYNSMATINDAASCDYPFVCDGVAAEVTVFGASFASEMGWSITDADGNVIDADANNYSDNTVNVIDVCLASEADYNFNLTDSYGDGWNGGTFIVTAECGVLAEGGLEEGDAATFAFTACGGSAGCEVPASWLVSITGANHTVMLPGDAAITIEDVQVAEGSAVGIFFTNSNGDLQCAGYTMVTGETVQIAAMGDDTTTDEIDGLAAGQSLTWMIWDGVTCTEIAATAIYSGGADVYTTNGITFVESITSVPAGPSCQTMMLPSGWSMFSTYMIADDMDLASALASIVDNVVIAKDNGGNAYLVQWDYNGVGDLTVGQGYQIKTDAEVSFEMCGTYAAPEDNPIALSAGWNIIGYLRTEPAAADAVLADVYASGNLTIAKDYAGNAYLPEFSFNGIGDMHPGQGYQLKTIEADVLNMLSNDESYRTATIEVSNKAVSHFATVAATDNNMTVVIEDAAWDVLPTEGAEIAAFDKAGNLIGSASYTSPLTVMSVWGDDATTETKDGLSVAEAVTFKVWSKDLTSTFEVSEWTEGSSAYEVNAINVASSITTNVLTDVTATERVLVKVINVLGQEVTSNEESFKGEILFNVYNDGTVEKVVK